jgi:hypothetical protein
MKMIRKPQDLVDFAGLRLIRSFYSLICTVSNTPFSPIFAFFLPGSMHH